MYGETKQIQIVLNTPIGPLTEARRHRVAEFLGPEYVPQPTPLPNSMLMVNHAHRKTVFVAEAQLNATHDGESLEYDASNWFHSLGGLREALLLDDRFPAMVQIVAHVEAEGSATEQSVHCFSPLPEDDMRARFDGLRGVGLRINFERPPYICDLNVEPYFQNATRFFLKLSASGQAPVSLELLVEDVAQFHRVVNDDAVRFLEATLAD
ncbi:MAG: hypothetical protein HRF45_02120 [Fimbriimonadia bacterium]|jgi:hypothetical protein